jgi:hypothetical protein
MRGSANVPLVTINVSEAADAGEGDKVPAELSSGGRYVKVGLLAFLAVVGFDLFLHAGVLSPLYTNPTPFLLDPETAFRRIPLGYAAFALLVVLAEWLVIRLDVRGARRGSLFGLELGALVWGSLALGLASITSARPLLLIGWAVGQTLELGLAGGVLAAGFAVDSLRALTWRVIVLFFVLAILGIVIQNLV